jgi:hypothetical protein
MGSWHTWNGRSLAMHRSLGGQSRDVSQAVWHRLNAHTSGASQSVLRAQPEASCTPWWVPLDEHAETRPTAIVATAIARKRMPMVADGQLHSPNRQASAGARDRGDPARVLVAYSSGFCARSW